MSRFLLAWELGGGLGHAKPLAQIAAPLLAAGHEVHCALRDLSLLVPVFGPLAAHARLHAWQAPVWLPPLAGLPQPATYAELLFRAGYLDAGRLQGLVQAWRRLLQAVQPQLLLADHAPTALLAARGWPMRRALVGNGFFLPLQRQPIPAFRDWEPIAPRRVQASEERVLASCNAVLAALGQAPLAALHELLAADERFLTTWPELDHFPARADEPGVHHWGALTGPTSDAAADTAAITWPAGEFGRLFAYLKPEHAATEAALALLQAGPWSTLAYVPGLAGTLKQRHASPHLVFVDRPVPMAAAAAQADAVLCHAGSGTVCAALQAGKPVVMLPMHAEQLLFARRVQAAGAGSWLLDGQVGSQLAVHLQQALSGGAMRQAAQVFAARHAGRGDEVAHRIAERCMALAGA